MGIYIQYNPLFPCSDFWSQTCQMWGGVGGVIFFLHFMLFPTFPEQINSGNKKQFFFFRKTIVDRDSGNLYPIFIKKKNCGVSFWTGDLGRPSCLVLSQMFFLHFMLFQTFLEKLNSGNKKKLFYIFFLLIFVGGGGGGGLALLNLLAGELKWPTCLVT